MKLAKNWKRRSVDVVPTPNSELAGVSAISGTWLPSRKPLLEVHLPAAPCVSLLGWAQNQPALAGNCCTRRNHSSSFVCHEFLPALSSTYLGSLLTLDRVIRTLTSSHVSMPIRTIMSSLFKSRCCGPPTCRRWDSSS